MREDLAMFVIASAAIYIIGICWLATVWWYSKQIDRIIKEENEGPDLGPLF